MNSLPVKINELSFAFQGNIILDRLSLEVRRGDFVCITGRNGSGKTTLIKLLLGLLQPQQGEIFLYGQPLRNFKAWNKIGYVPQKATFIEQKFPATVREIVTAGRFPRLGLWGSFTRADQLAVNQALAAVGIEDLAERPIGQLSGGQQQRVFIAKALAGEPDILLLDEPMTGIDRETQDKITGLLISLNRQKGLTLIMVTHDSINSSPDFARIVCLGRERQNTGRVTKSIDDKPKEWGDVRVLSI